MKKKQRLMFSISIIFLLVVSLALFIYSNSENKSMTGNTIFPSVNWAVSTPQAQGLDQVMMQQIGNMMQSEGSNGILIRNGYQVAQWNYHGNMETAIKAASITKSITSMLLGIAIKEGKIASLDSLVKDYAPSVVGDLQYRNQITFRHLVTRTAGLYQRGTSCGLDYGGWTYDRPPGTELHYSCEEWTRLGRALTYVFNEDLLSVLNSRVLSRIGASVSQWELDYVENVPTGKMTTANGATVPVRNGAANSYWTPKNLAKVGYLYLNNGKWETEQIIPESYVTASWTPVSFYTDPEDFTAPGDMVTVEWGSVYARSVIDQGPLRYGLGWWNNGPGWFMSGHGMQFVYVWPEQNMVLVKLNDWWCCRKYDINFFIPLLLHATVGDANPTRLAGMWRCNTDVDNSNQDSQSTSSLTQNVNSAVGTATSSSGSSYSLTAKLYGNIRTDNWIKAGYWATGYGQLAVDGNSYTSNWIDSSGASGIDSCTKIGSAGSCLDQTCDNNPANGIVDVGDSCSGTFKTSYQKDAYKNINFNSNNLAFVEGEWISRSTTSLGWYYAYGNCSQGTYPRWIYINTATGGAYGEFSCNQVGNNYCSPTQETTQTCTSFSYSSWSVCSSSATQTRTISSRLPNGCTGGNSESLNRQCSPPCNSANWISILTPTTCSASGTQTRSWSKAGNCNESISSGFQRPVNTVESCNPTIVTCSNFIYSNWSSCEPSGIQIRTIDSSSPSGCVGGNPATSQTCNYASFIPDAPNSVPDSNSPELDNPASSSASLISEPNSSPPEISIVLQEDINQPNLNPSSQNPSSQDSQTTETKSSSVMNLVLIRVICWFSNISDEEKYKECLLKYLL